MPAEPKLVVVPEEPPESIPSEFDQALFDLCRKDDYRGLYRELVRRAKVRDA